VQIAEMNKIHYYLDIEVYALLKGSTKGAAHGIVSGAEKHDSITVAKALGISNMSYVGMILLETHYLPKSIGKKIELFRTIMDHKIPERNDPRDSLITLSQKYDNLSTMLTSPLSNELRTLFTVSALPSTYDGLITATIVKDDDDLEKIKTDDLNGKINNQYQTVISKKRTNEISAMDNEEPTRPNKKQKFSAALTTPMAQQTCGRCGKKGHTTQKCYTKPCPICLKNKGKEFFNHNAYTCKFKNANGNSNNNNNNNNNRNNKNNNRYNNNNNNNTVNANELQKQLAQTQKALMSLTKQFSELKGKDNKIFSITENDNEEGYTFPQGFEKPGRSKQQRLGGYESESD